MSAADMTLRHWTQLEDLPEPLPNSPPGSESTEPQERKWVLRPLYYRLPVALVHLGIGYGIINLVLTSRARTVRRIWVLPPTEPTTSSTANSTIQAARAANNLKTTPSTNSNTSPTLQSLAPTQISPKSQLIIQSAKHLSTQGRVSQLRACSLVSGSVKDTSSDSLRLKIPGFQGLFTIGLDGVLIDGEKKDARAAGEALRRLWGKRVKWVANQA